MHAVKPCWRYLYWCVAYLPLLFQEPFVELMKGSLNTFLNAFTYPDRTCYPVASANLQVWWFTDIEDRFLLNQSLPRAIFEHTSAIEAHGARRYGGSRNVDNATLFAHKVPVKGSVLCSIPIMYAYLPCLIHQSVVTAQESCIS